VNANSRLGTSESANALAKFAANENSFHGAAAEALHDLATWSDPGTRDRIVGVYRPFNGARNSRDAANALQSVAGKILSGARSDEVKLAAIDAIQNLRLTSANNSLQKVFAAKNNSEKVRLAALKVLGESNFAALPDVVKIAQNDSNELIRKEGNRLATQLDPSDAIAQIRSVLNKGSVPEKQGAIASLGGIKGAKANRLLSELLDKMLAKQLPHEVELELLEAAAKHPSPALNAKVVRFNAENSSDSLAGFREALYGGDADAGKKIFFEKAEASCVRCHKINNEGGEVGPVLTGIGSRKPREYLLESIVHPNAQIAPGFDTVLVLMKNGASYAGVFKSENEKELVINSPEDGIVKIAKADIKSRNRGASGMPDGLGQILSKRDLRDLVEFLAESK
jgi:quinoprotein glucose dehydrogenase